MIVVDASAALDGLLDPATHSRVAASLTGATEPLAAPDLIDVEVMSVLRRWERAGEITPARARQALSDLAALPLARYPARAVVDEAWELRHNLTAYDAQYVALAQAIPATLLTTDRRMADAARQVGVDVVSLRSSP